MGFGIYRCWCAEPHGETQDDAVVVEAEGFDHAAEIYAADCYDYGDHFDAATVFVSRDGEVKEFEVEVDMSPHFNACELTDGKQ